jgi:hypothetical protein
MTAYAGLHQSLLATYQAQLLSAKPAGLNPANLLKIRNEDSSNRQGFGFCAPAGASQDSEPAGVWKRRGRFAPPGGAWLSSDRRARCA